MSQKAKTFVPYAGVLVKTKMPPLERKAYYIWMEQRARCTRTNHKFFASYGGKGITVEYSSRDFIGWYVAFRPYVQGDRVDVGRVDHEKNYAFSNIAFEQHSHNVGERNNRVGNPNPSRIVVAFRNKQVIGEYRNTRDAAAELGINQTSVVRSCAKQIKITKSGLNFRYKESRV